MNWQPIETAPKDGTRILAYGVLGLESHKSIGTVKWNDTCSLWQCDPSEASEYHPEACDLTHWMPLPEAPK
jgi:hypothetical protein